MARSCCAFMANRPGVILDQIALSASDGGSPPSGGRSATATVSITVKSCFVEAIGTSTGTWDFPLHTYYHDCRTQTIYLAGEIGRAGNISALALNVTAIPQQAMNISPFG